MVSRVFVSALLVITLVFGSTSSVEREPKIKINPKHTSWSAPSQYIEIGGKEYFFSERVALTWFESQEKCEERNMTLASIETEEENMALMDYFQNNPESDVWRWTSGYRSIDSGEWNWNSTGEPFSFLGWGPDQPSNTAEIEDCCNFLALFKGWDDDECDGFLMSYMCEA